MKTAICLIAAFAITAAAADKLNFSGEWKMNIAKSMFGPVPPPTSFTRKITHAEPTLTIADDQKGGSGDQSNTRTYTTDGKEITYQASGTEVKGSATLEGDALILKSNIDAGGITLAIVEKMTLTNGGKTLADAIHIGTPQGDIDLTYVFEK
jgi:hypothetical protein